MYPVLLHFGGVSWPAFHTLMLVGYLGGAALAVLLAPRLELTRGAAVRIAVVLALMGTLGAKLGHLLLESPGHLLADGSETTGILDLLQADPWHWARLLDGGYVWYGGLLLGGLGLWLMTRRSPGGLASSADLVAPGMAWGIAVGRLGCLLAGCCHGRPTASGLGLEFVAGPAAGLGPLFPVQLLDAGFGAVLLGVLLWRLPRRRFAGELALLALVAYSAVRFLLEFGRGDVERGLLFDGAASWSQLISLAIFAPSLYMLARGWRRGGSAASPHPATLARAEAGKP